MPAQRAQQISLADTPYYHFVSRCVRRVFLCGEDKFSGKSYKYRRSWVEMRLLFLAKIFCIDVCAYAVMSNHTHVVLHVNRYAALQLTDEEVMLRWHQMFKANPLINQFLRYR